MDSVASRVLLRRQHVPGDISVDAGDVAVAWYVCGRGVSASYYDTFSRLHPICCIAEVVVGGMNQLTGTPPAAFPPTLSTCCACSFVHSCGLLSYTAPSSLAFSSIRLSRQLFYGWYSAGTLGHVPKTWYVCNVQSSVLRISE